MVMILEKPQWINHIVIQINFRLISTTNKIISFLMLTNNPKKVQTSGNKNC